MISKQNLWFLTLFSLVLVLSVYYVTMPSDLLLKEEVKNNENIDDIVNLEVEESEILVSLRLDLEEERMGMKKELESVLTNSEATNDEKNEAYDKLNYISTLQSKEEKLQEKIKREYNIESFIEINGNEINIVAISNEHNTTIANNIMRSIQEEYSEKVYVTVNFK